MKTTLLLLGFIVFAGCSKPSAKPKTVEVTLQQMQQILAIAYQDGINFEDSEIATNRLNTVFDK